MDTLPSEVHSLLAETDYLEREYKESKPTEKNLLLRHIKTNLDRISTKLEEIEQWLKTHDDLDMKKKYDEFFKEHKRLKDHGTCVFYNTLT